MNKKLAHGISQKEVMRLVNLYSALSTLVVFDSAAIATMEAA